jgi:hypothetical protein
MITGITLRVDGKNATKKVVISMKIGHHGS